MEKTKFDPRSHIGEVHGIYTIVDMNEEKDKYGHYIYKGVCNECGYIKYAHYGNFSGEKSKTIACNHLAMEGGYKKNIQWNNERLRKIFRGMKTRCYDENDKSYRWYGSKGIKICDEWINNPKLFEEWALNNGYSDDLTIDRIDESKDYCPNNCRWVTLKDNAKYKSTTSLIDVDGITHTGQDWSRELGLGVNIINTYVRKHGEENAKEFIRRYIKNPNLKRKGQQSYYDVYMYNLNQLNS